MIYIETGSKSIYTNLATEYFIATESDILEKTGEDSAFLFWTTTPTLVVGKYQNVYEEVNLTYARENGLNIVRRMSGGGTMYMDEGGWQFSFITADNSDGISFAEFLEPILSALASLGVKAEFSGRNDILIDGRKVSGNSQYKLGGKTVHHGTLLFATDPERIVRSTTVADYKIISKGIKSVRERVTNISDHISDDISTEKFKDLMIDHILGDGKRHILSHTEQKRIAEIAAEKFADKDAIFGASPKFSIVKNAHLKGGMIEMSFDVKKGIITDCAVKGDFFSDATPEMWHDTLCGCMYEYDAVKSAIEKAGISILDISSDEIAKLITE